MQHNAEPQPPHADLRRQAEAVLKHGPPNMAHLSPMGLQRLVHELYVHQVELELQNAELRRSQADLQAARDKYAELYDRAPVGYLTLDPRGTILAANTTAAALLGVERASLPHTPLARFLVREDQDTFYLHRRQVFEDDTPRRCDLRLQRSDGTVVVVALESRRVQEATDQESQCFTTLSDITARKQAEEALQSANDELEERVLGRTAALARAYAELKRFAEVASHDLRAPLINLRGFARELQAACDVIYAVLPQVLPHVDETQRAALTTAVETDIPESVDFIQAATTRMNRLVDALVQLAHLGRRPLHIEPVDMDALVHHLLQTVHQLLTERQVRVRVDVLPPLRADEAAMHHIMGHLLSNALASLVPDRPGELHIWGEAGPDVTTVHVRDNGRGIAEADIPKVFQVFRRLGTPEVAGAGMGLAYVQTLVRRHGGDIWCQSTPGIGTTFTFTIAHHLDGVDMSGDA